MYTKYNVLYDLDRTICFIGNCHINTIISNELERSRQVERITLEEIVLCDSEWFKQRQFFCGISSIVFKKHVVETIAHHSPHYVTIIDSNASVDRNAQIGHNTLISGSTFVVDDTSIGNHTMVNSSFLSHENVIGNFCHISPLSYLSFSKLGQGVAVGINSIFAGHPTRIITVPDWCNFSLNSRVTRAIDVTGTYFGHKKLNNETSLTTNIL